LLTYRPPNKNRPAVGQGGDQPNNWKVRLSATNGKLVISAVKIVVAKKVDKLSCVHVILDCNGVERMCQAIESGFRGLDDGEEWGGIWVAFIVLYTLYGFILIVGFKSG
jgi:hypothetical protein